MTPYRLSAAVALTALGTLFVPAVGSAQPMPDETIHGIVKSWDGHEQLYVNDDRGFVDEVAVGDETVFRPAADRVAPGMRVKITGYNGGHWFDAATVDVEAAASSPVAQAPAPPEPGPAYPAAPAQAYAQPYAQPYPVAVPVYVPYPAYAYPAYAYPAYGYRAYPPVRVNLGFWFGGRPGWRR